MAWSRATYTYATRRLAFFSTFGADGSRRPQGLGGGQRRVGEPEVNRLSDFPMKPRTVVSAFERGRWRAFDGVQSAAGSTIGEWGWADDKDAADDAGASRQGRQEKAGLCGCLRKQDAKRLASIGVRFGYALRDTNGVYSKQNSPSQVNVSVFSPRTFSLSRHKRGGPWVRACNGARAGPTPAPTRRREVC